MSETFPNDQWSTLREHMESGGVEAVVAYVDGHEPLQRRQLYHFAVRAFANQEWARDLDRYVALAEAGIDECLRQAADEPDPDTATRRTDLANVLAYNASAALCDCWEQRPPLERRHFEAGLALADRCLAWRDALGKGPWPRSMAWWAKGMHLLSLDRPTEAAAAFERAVAFAREHAAAEQETEPELHDAFGIALSEGYRGVAELRAGIAGGQDRYDAACAAFARMTAREDAEFGLAQLRTVRERYAG